ncbi:MAG TPA: chromosomal replication initiator protein DnaA [Candidatus Marinimicrobia bacterium]|nr:chromosomal replication initiator protein DnaA [Candidatus Neomarinimicrobiota bacterium]HRS50845.1 chromosomal replication initiator protein DnaA [Candidatus Neomarinimicrobiota bacterium]HRU91814.1 chromosomal replication initiator protein DnaA [Candidatus Neomarinimicrobiota bacterium]
MSDSLICGDVWSKCLEYVRTKIPQQTFETWFVPMKAISLANDTLILQVPNKFFYEWVDNHYRDMLLKAIKEITGNGFGVSYTVLLGEESDKFPGASTAHNQRNASSSADETEYKSGAREQGTRLNERYVFDTFVEGASNQFARAAAMAVASAPGRTSFNPLVIYGGTGLGKTHLLQAIGNEALSNGRARKVIYVSSDTFTLDFIAAIQNNKTTEFSRYYRNIDMLLLDDIQFFQNKEQTQEQFFHIFNDLYQRHKQIVLTTDKPPMELRGLQERLLSRFQSSLTVDIQPPDLETRIAILQKKANDDGLDIPYEVIEYLSMNIRSNIRELEGALIRLLAYSSLLQVDIDINLTQRVLREILGTRHSSALSIENVQSTVSTVYKINLDSMVGKGRTKEVAEARMIAMYLTREFTGLSLKTIGLYFGGRDHSTVVHACRWVEERLQSDSIFARQINDLKAKLSQNIQ